MAMKTPPMCMGLQDRMWGACERVGRANGERQRAPVSMPGLTVSSGDRAEPCLEPRGVLRGPSGPHAAGRGDGLC